MYFQRISLVAGVAAVLLAGCTQSPQVAGKPGQTPTVNVAASGAAFPQIKDRRPAPKSNVSVDKAETDAANGGSKRDLGIVYYSTGGFAAAQKALDEAVAQKDSDGIAWLYLGYAAMGNGDVDRAVDVDVHGPGRFDRPCDREDRQTQRVEAGDFSHYSGVCAKMAPQPGIMHV